MKTSEGDSDKKFGYGVRHIQMVCMCLTMVALFIARGSMGVAVLAMTDSSRDDIETYKWDKKTQSLILSSFFWGYTVMQIPGGILCKRYGGKPILLVSLLTNTVICGLLPTLVKIGGWPIVCVCRVIMGLTQACLFPASHTLLGRWLPVQERTSYSGIVYGGTQIGIIIAMPISGVLAETKVGWKSIFYTVSAIMFVTAGIWSFFSANMPKEHPLMTEEERRYIERGLNAVEAKELRTPWRHIFRTRALWATMVAHVGCTVGFVLFFVDMPTYMEHGLRISLKNSAILSALPYIGMLCGNVSSSAICERIYNRGYWSLVTCRKVFNSISFFGLSLGLIALAFIGPENKILAIIILVLSLFLNGFMSAGFLMSHLDLSPNYAGVMLSLTNAAANFGSMLTPIGTSFILRNDPIEITSDEQILEDGWTVTSLTVKPFRTAIKTPPPNFLFRKLPRSRRYTEYLQSNSSESKIPDISRWRIVFLATAAVGVVANTVFLLFASAEQREWDDPYFIEKMKADPEEVKPALKPVKEDSDH